MAQRTEAYTAGMTRPEAFLMLTNIDPHSRKPMMSAMVAESALTVAYQEGAWWSPRFAILHFSDGFAIVRGNK